MASLPKPDPEWVPMAAEDLLAIRGTPEYEEELRKQAVLLREHRHRYPGNYPEPDWAWLDKVWK